MPVKSDIPIKRASISVKGKLIEVPAYSIDGRLVVVTGKWLKVARIHEEEWMELPPIQNMDNFLAALKKAAPSADLFTFAQDLSISQPQYPFPFELEDVAAVPITTFPEWWDALPQESRKNVRKAEKRGVVVKLATFDDAFVAGIKSIYDEAPLRQGRRFWHYGKDLETVRSENATFLERSEFVAAYFENELIGFIKMVYVGKIARIMQILSKNAHIDKKPPNILLSKATEACAQKGMTHFIYGKYFYGNKGHTPITEFKRRNGFKRIQFPQYFVPLTLKGKMALSLKLHRGIQEILPQRVTNFLLDVRSRLNGSKSAPKKEPTPEKESKPA
jgi:hypothetical protein